LASETRALLDREWHVVEIVAGYLLAPRGNAIVDGRERRPEPRNRRDRAKIANVGVVG
jgi:hypothetical protein